MKLVLIADTHGQHWDIDLPAGDALLHAGDLCSYGSMQELQAAAEFLKAQRENFDQVIAIGGNHDWPLVKQPDIAQRLMRDSGIIYLQDNGVEIGGLHFWGTPWTPRFADWAFMGFSFELKQIYSLIPSNTDVLISHGPPFGILDKGLFDPHAGSSDLYDILERVKPKLHVFGHLHEQGGSIEKIGNTTFVNAAQLDDGYQLTHKPIVIEI